MSKPRLAILGAGLTGLTLAYRLQSRYDVTIFESRDRVGGRILTDRKDGLAPVEMGATWFGNKHRHLTALLTELGLSPFEQRTGGRAIYESISTSPPQVIDLPPNDEPSYRIAGGSDALTHALRDRLNVNIRLKEAVEELEWKEDTVLVSSERETGAFDRAVATLPPNLFYRTIRRTPELPAELLKLAGNTHTWMGESIKVGFRFPRAFWKGKGPGGTIFSNVGPVTEMYDHTDVNEQTHALKGFMNGAYHSLAKEERRSLIVEQLHKYYGDNMDDGAEYLEYVWRYDPHTFAPNEGHVLPHQHNGHPAFREAFWDGRLYLAGSETDSTFPGYMDGAVGSAEYVARRLRALIS